MCTRGYDMFEAVRAPILSIVDRVSIATFNSGRATYLSLVAETNALHSTSIAPRSLKSRFERDMLEAICELALEVAVDVVSEQELTTYLDGKMGKPADAMTFQFIESVVTKQLKTDMSIIDPSHRILNLFMNDKALVSKYGFGPFLSRACNKKYPAQFIVAGILPKQLSAMVADELRYVDPKLKTDLPLLHKRVAVLAAEMQRYTSTSSTIAATARTTISCSQPLPRNHTLPPPPNMPPPIQCVCVVASTRNATATTQHTALNKPVLAASNNAPVKSQLVQTAVSTADAPAKNAYNPRPIQCLHCPGHHHMRDCPQAPSAEQRQAAWDAFNERVGNTRSYTRSGTQYSTRRLGPNAHVKCKSLAHFGNEVALPYCLDYGADITLVVIGCLSVFNSAGIWVASSNLQPEDPIVVLLADSSEIRLLRKIRLNIALQTCTSMVHLPDVTCFVVDGPLHEIRSSRPILDGLGLN